MFQRSDTSQVASQFGERQGHSLDGDLTAVEPSNLSTASARRLPGESIRTPQLRLSSCLYCISIDDVSR